MAEDEEPLLRPWPKAVRKGKDLERLFKAPGRQSHCVSLAMCRCGKTCSRARRVESRDTGEEGQIKDLGIQIPLGMSQTCDTCPPPNPGRTHFRRLSPCCPPTSRRPARPPPPPISASPSRSAFGSGPGVRGPGPAPDHRRRRREPERSRAERGSHREDHKSTTWGEFQEFFSPPGSRHEIVWNIILLTWSGELMNQSTSRTLLSDLTSGLVDPDFSLE